jgi:hypothetical protein
VFRAPSSDPELVASELRVVIGRLSRRLREEAGSLPNLSRAEGAVLRQLEATGPLPWHDDAFHDEVGHDSPAEALSALVASGLVGVSVDSGGVRWFTLSDQARVQLARNRLAREDWLFRAVRTCLTETQQWQLAESLELLRQLADSA